MDFKNGFKSISKTILCIIAFQSTFSLFISCSNENPNSPQVFTNPPLVKILSVNSIFAVNDLSSFTVSAYDSNGIVKAYLWSFDGITFDTTYVPAYKTIWSPANFGEKTIYAKVIDNDGVVSTIDSMKFVVHQYAPVVTALNYTGQIHDTTISFKDSLYVKIAAADSNGQIMKCFLDIGADGWDDSTNYQNSIRHIKYPAGGYVTIVVGAEDDDGIMGTDTFHALFNRPPTSCGLKTDYNTEKNGWSDYNYSTGTGSFQASFLVQDPDGAHDNFNYDFYWGAYPNSLTQQYSGIDTIVSVFDIPIQTQFYWKVVARDFFGDSVAQSGIYSLNTAPSNGLFWNLATNNLIVPFAISQPTSFDGKMWIFIKNNAVSKGFGSDNKPLFDYYYSVYNSIDCINWNLVTKNLIVPFAMPQPTSFNEKMWIFINNNTVPNGVDADGKPLYTYYHSVYNSTDCTNWNLVANTMLLPFAMPQPTSFDGKMWIFINDNTVTKGSDSQGRQLFDYYHSVYNSTDCINWNLVTNTLLLPFSMPQPTSFDGKMWIFITTNTVLKGSDPDGRQLFDYFHSVYNSTDCINWNLVTNTTIVPFSMPQPTSFDDKMWIFINTIGVPKGNDADGKPLIDYYHSVYTSGK